MDIIGNMDNIVDQLVLVNTLFGKLNILHYHQKNDSLSN